MDSKDKNETSRLKKELDHSRKAFEKWNLLIQKRENLEKEIEERQTKQIRHAEEAELITKELASLKTHLKDLDHLLDHLEEHSFEKIESIENQLIENILENYPELKSEWNDLQFTLAQKENHVKNLQSILQSIENIQQLLQTALEARQRVKRQGIFSYIFGFNPNQIISQHLHAIADQIQTILPWFEERKNDLEFTDFLKELQKESRQRWGFRKMDHFFKEAALPLDREKEKIREEKISEELKYQVILQQKEEWLKKNAKL